VPYRVSVRWIVDGMNVIGSRPDGWWKDRGGAMIALVESLDRWASVQGEDVTVVFERPPATAVISSVIEVAHAPERRRTRPTTRSSGWCEPTPDRRRFGW
jgi:hypothetical protein